MVSAVRKSGQGGAIEITSQHLIQTESTLITASGGSETSSGGTIAVRTEEQPNSRLFSSASFSANMEYG